MRKLHQLVGPLISELPGSTRFSVLGIAFPLAGLVLILLRSEDRFRFRGEKSGFREREVSDERLALCILKYVEVDGHAQGVCIVSLDDEREFYGVNGMKSHAVLFKMCKKSGGREGHQYKIWWAYADHGAVDNCVVEGVILDQDLPESL